MENEKNVDNVREYKERRLYYFRCSGCGTKNRVSLKRKRANDGLCRNCRKNAVPEGQATLFENRATL